MTKYKLHNIIICIFVFINIFIMKGYTEINDSKDYLVNRNGDVFSLKSNRHLTKTLSNKGYLFVTIKIDRKNKQKRINRLVAEAFISNPENKPQVNHINGIKTDNRVENLEWCTAKENTIHAYKTGLNKNILDNHHSAKLTSRDVSMLRYLSKEFKCTSVDLSSFFKTSHTNISENIYRGGWGSVDYVITKEDILECKEIKKKIDSTKTNNRGKSVLQKDLNGNVIKKWNRLKDIEDELGYDKANVSACCLGKKITYKGFKWKYYG